MEGFKGYQHRVKIGNWSEDMELEAVSSYLSATYFNSTLLIQVLICRPSWRITYLKKNEESWQAQKLSKGLLTHWCQLSSSPDTMTPSCISETLWCSLIKQLTVAWLVILMKPYLKILSPRLQLGTPNLVQGTRSKYANGKAKETKKMLCSISKMMLFTSDKKFNFGAMPIC